MVESEYSQNFEVQEANIFDNVLYTILQFSQKRKRNGCEDITLVISYNVLLDCSLVIATKYIKQKYVLS